jgi:hypothetical protein
MSGVLGLGDQKQTSTKQVAPWGALAPYISSGYQEAAKLYSQGPAQYTPWSQTAGLNNIQEGVLNRIGEYINNPELQSKMAGAQGVVRGLLDQQQNPYSGSTNVAQNQLARSLTDIPMDASSGLNRMMYQDTTDQALQTALGKGQLSVNQNIPQIKSLLQNPIASGLANKIAAGSQANILSRNLADAYDAQNKMRSIAAGTTNQINQLKSGISSGLLDAANRYGTSATGLGLSNAEQTLNMPIAMLGELNRAGTIQQQANQAQLTDATNRWNYQQNAPYSNLARFRNLINPDPSWGVTSSTTTTPGSGQGVGQLAGMVLGGVGGAFAGGPQGAMMGAQLGGSLGGGIGSQFH